MNLFKPDPDGGPNIPLSSEEASAWRQMTEQEIERPASPVLVTPRQARLALLEAGLLDQVQAAVTAAGGATQIAWEYATVLDRNDALIVSIGTALDLSPSQIDALFTQAATL